MKLTEAQTLLGEHSRYFSEVYKQFSFRDDQTLKEYLDFIQHEPVEWMKGFPSKLTTKSTFSRPKAILVKLLKMDAVKLALGEEYVTKAYAVIWKTFKNNLDMVLTTRNNTHHANVLDQMTESNEPLREDEVESIPSVAGQTGHHEDHANGSCESCTKWEQKYNLLLNVTNSLLHEYSMVTPGLMNAALLLLSSVSTA